MLKSYIKIGLRNLWTNKGYTFINVIGLAIGVAACLLIFLIVQFETSFDTFHGNKDSIYRVITTTPTANGVEKEAGVPIPTSAALRIDFPQLKNVASIFKNGGQFNIESNANGHSIKKFKEDNTYYSESQFFNIFNFKWLAGDKKTALKEPLTAVLTRDEADKFFGDWHSALGKTIKLDNKVNFRVTGILENVPINTDFPLKVVLSYASILTKSSGLPYNTNDWVSIYGSHYCFIVLPDGLPADRFNNNLTSFVKKHKPAEYANQNMQLQPLRDMHYNPEMQIFSNHPFSKELINAISFIGLFLLIIACVNFINLATAQAVKRSKEVGIRKVLGSHRIQLMLQFIIETLIITVFAVVLAIVLALSAIHYINNLLEVTLSASLIYNWTVILFILGVIVGVTILSGLYPAIVISGYNPVSAIKNKVVAQSAKGISLRRGLVVLQFCIAQILVIGTLVIINQMNFFKNKSLGFDKEAVLTVPFPNDSVNLTKINALRNQLLQLQGVKDVSYSFTSPSDNNGWYSDFRYDNSAKRTDFGASLKWADAEYFKMYNIKFIAGQPYSNSDTIQSFVVNEALLKKLGVKDPKTAIGKRISLFDNKKAAQIIGVVKDFNISSLKQEIPPVLMSSWKGVYSVINIKIQPANVNKTLAGVEELWNTTFPNGIYEYQFLDDKIAQFYKSEDQLSQLYKIFAGIAIFISCLGLYGLVSFMAVQRIKEVGIRKTLGASAAHIVYLFSKEFTVLIIIAFAISAPIGWYIMGKWLQDFNYRITIGPGIFIISIIASVIIAWLTVAYKSIVAAMANPIKSLRTE